MKPESKSPVRQCLTTREHKAPSEMIRFVLDPDGRVVPDIRRRLPGRGVWVSGSGGCVRTAQAKRLFARGFRSQVQVEGDLAGQADMLLEQDALATLSMAQKAGLAVCGFEKVRALLRNGTVEVLVEAADAADDGRRKLLPLVTRRSDDHKPVSIIGTFSSDALSTALGRERAVHVALRPGRLSEIFKARAQRLERYRDGFADAERLAIRARTDSRDEASSGLKAV